MNKSKFDQQSSTLTFSDPTRKMEFTGERYVSGHVGPTQHAHHHRYLFSVGLCQGKDVLDIASGEGYGADLLARTAASVVGIDISESTIEFAKKTYERPGLQFLCGSVANIPLPDHSFDVVVSFETIEHLAEQEAALAEMKRVLRPDGILIISSPNRPIYSDKKHHKNPFHVRELDLEEFRNLLERHFPHVSVYSQSQLTGSMVFKNEGIEKDITVYATEDSLTYSIEDPVSVAQYFIAVAGIRELELEDGSILMNGEYVPRLQAENAWHKKQSQNERSRADKAEKLEEQFQALAKKTANILTEHGAALQDQRKALEERIDAARATLEAKLNRIGSAQSNLQETLFEVIAHQKVERASGFSARLSTLVDDTKYLLQFLKLQADAFRRYPLSRRKRRAFVQRRVESASIEYAQNIDIASKRIGRGKWRLKAALKHPVSKHKRHSWRRANPYQHPTSTLKTRQEHVLTDEVRSIPVQYNSDPANSLHGKLFDTWVNNALGKFDDGEHVPIARFPPPSNLFDVKLIAYYLPQFHPIPENNAWWGEGFTEWRNVVRAFPNFEGHYQPRIPGELGFYDLRVPEVMARQVELAKLYGISAFCFHFYWFGGKTLLELPISSYLQRKELDLPFCLCWANENWSRRWDGSEHEVLIAQKHSPEDDEAFLRYLDQYFKDERYLKIDGKPILTIYRPSILPDAKATTDRWRRLARELGYPGLYLIATNAFAFKDYEALGFDALSEFPPHHVAAENVQNRFQMTSQRTGWRVRLYSDVVSSELVRDAGQGRIHPGIMMAWDNSARRPLAGEIIHGSTPALFRQWLRRCLERAQANPDGEQLVFVNAWNEWAEGTYLEPDKRFGYAFLTACADEIRQNVNGVEFTPEIHMGSQQIDPTAATILVCGHNAHAQVFGAERSLLDVLRAMASGGHNIVVTLPAAPHPDYLEALLALVCEVRIFHYAQWTRDIQSSLYSVPEFMATLRDVRAKLVYVNTIVLRAPLEAAQLSGIPVIVHARKLILADDDLQAQIGLPGESIVRFISRHSAHIVANSAATAASFTGNAPVSTVHNIVDLDAFDLPPASSDGQVRFALISNNLPKKGIDDFVELASRCLETAPQARFLVIGPTDRPGIKDYLNGRRNAPSNVEFVGYIPAATDAMARADVVLNLSHFQESFGRTVLEAMAASRPVIVYDWGALPELVEDGKSGYVVPYRDLDKVVNAVQALMDPATLARMGNAARLRATNIADRDTHDSKIRGILAGLLDNVERRPTQAPDDMHLTDVAIVICVHNALDDVRACLASVELHREAQHRVILVDDGSQQETADFLRAFAASRDYVTLHRNEMAQGYTKAVNVGAGLADSDVIILLNSDTVVTPGWAGKLVRALQSSPGVGIAGPLSNAASFQSIPDVRSSTTQTAVNALPDGWSPDNMNRLCEAHADRQFPAVALVHGFCFAMTREVWDSVGPFDEEAFPRGFGEENDFCFRAADAGFAMVVATDTYIYHAKSKSYGEGERHALADAAQEVLYSRHGRKRFMDSIRTLDQNPALRRMRRIAALSQGG